MTRLLTPEELERLRRYRSAYFSAYCRTCDRRWRPDDGTIGDYTCTNCYRYGGVAPSEGPVEYMDEDGLVGVFE